MRLIVLCILHQDLLSTYPVEQSETPSIQSNDHLLTSFFAFEKLEEFLVIGLLNCPGEAIRAELMEALVRLCKHSPSNINSLQIQIGNDLYPSPLAYLLKFLLNHLPDHKTNNVAVWSTCGQVQL